MVDDVHELETFGLRRRFGRWRNHANFLITHGLENANQERVLRGHLSEKVLKRRPYSVANGMSHQSATKRAALLPEARSRLPGESSTGRIGATSSEHLPAEHRAMPVLRNPELKYLVLRSKRAAEVVTQSQLTRKPTVEVLHMLLAHAQHTLEISDITLPDEDPTRGRYRGAQHRIVGYIL